VKSSAQAIHAATYDPAMQQRAAELGQRIRAEDGVGAAIELIRQYLDQQKETDT
jgi:UDP:flavonoid glycosyltransferase YjiC (YdhE family)